MYCHNSETFLSSPIMRVATLDTQNVHARLTIPSAAGAHQRGTLHAARHAIAAAWRTAALTPMLFLAPCTNPTHAAITAFFRGITHTATRTQRGTRTAAAYHVMAAGIANAGWTKIAVRFVGGRILPVGHGRSGRDCTERVATAVTRALLWRLFLLFLLFLLRLRLVVVIPLLPATLVRVTAICAHAEQRRGQCHEPRKVLHWCIPFLLFPKLLSV